MFRKSRTAWFSAAGALASAVAAFHLWSAEKTAPPAATLDKIDYNRDIRPILSENCYACHGPDSNKRKAGLRLDRKEDAFKKLESGSVPIVAGNLASSELYKRIISTDDDERMPSVKSGKKLSAAQIDLLKRWIERGAVWTPHWSYIPPQRPPLPVAKNKSWPKNPIDNFVLDRLERAGLAPGPEAEKVRLIRRATLDLTGLPPTLEEVAAFLADKSANAFEKVVDRLLASSAYGERMAQFWLDLARYADTNGYHIDNNRDLWLWREWVINAFNRNMPFDQFTVEQIAGDLLPNATIAQKIASGFNRNEMVNFEGGADPNEYAVKYIVGRVDCTSRTFLGTTMACCECHDHKYDPISQKEYYKFFAFFNTISEQGLDGREESPLPRLQVASDEDKARSEQFKKSTAQLDQEQKQLLEANNQGWSLSQLVWETRQASAISNWKTVGPEKISSEAGADFETLEDQSVLARGAGGGKDVYDVVLKTSLKEITGLRLEALPHDSLPEKKAGRSDRGDFVLTAVEIEASNPDPSADAIELPQFSDWFSLGPFKGKDGREAFTKAFVSEREVDLAETFTNKLRWMRQTNWEDGVVHELKSENNTATYLYRTIFARRPTHMEISLGSDDGITVFLNGHKLLAKDISRPAAADQEKVVLRLAAGENQLLVKINNIEGGSSFYFKPLSHPINQYPVELSTAFADFSKKDFPISAVIEGKTNSGWSAFSEKTNEAHQAIFIPKQPLGFENGTELRVRLKFNSGEKAGALGHFRIALTGADGLPEFAGLPEKVRTDLFAPAAVRSVAQKKDLQKYYRETFVAEVKEHARRVAMEKDAAAKFEKSIPVTMVMQEMSKPRDTFLLVRGDWQNKGEKVSPDVPSVWPRLPEGPTNRLSLAKWLVDPGHPLTARVAMNHFWQQYFGEGIVRTPADFGSHGEWPTHPELLDWLAREFIESGWNVKHMQKLIVMSATYRQSSVVDPKKLERDPDNRFLSRGPRVRLEAEAIRDQALAVSGLLNRKMGGPSVRPYQPPGLWEAIGFTDNGNFSSQKYEQSPGDDNYRRGLYVYWKRSMPYASFVTFDAPSREVCTVKRPRTNTPLQALALMNDPVYLECARALGQRIMNEGGAQIRERLTFAFKLCLARAPSPEELNILERKFYEQLANFQADPQSAGKLIHLGVSQPPTNVYASELAAWTAIGNILLNLDETVTKG